MGTWGWISLVCVVVIVWVFSGWFYCSLFCKDEDVLSVALLLWTQFVSFLIVAHLFELLCWFTLCRIQVFEECWMSLAFSIWYLVSLEQLNFTSASVVYPICSHIICWLWSFYCLRCHCILRISEQCTLDCFRHGLCIIPNVPWQTVLSQLRCVGNTGRNISRCC